MEIEQKIIINTDLSGNVPFALFKEVYIESEHYRINAQKIQKALECLDSVLVEQLKILTEKAAYSPPGVSTIEQRQVEQLRFLIKYWRSNA